FMGSILLDSMQLIFGKYVTELMPAIGWFFNSAISILMSVIIVWTWFTMIFRYLPDGKPTWKVAITGALLTSILFNIGKYVLGLLLAKSNIGLVYGTSASIVLLLLFVFYSSLILYYGAAFTKVWSLHIKQPIIPINNAMFYVNVDREDKEEEGT
ncbi:MAG: YihY/virulence factor BrkB family protein, partial [Ferruginibacter sp.]